MQGVQRLQVKNGRNLSWMWLSFWDLQLGHACFSGWWLQPVSTCFNLFSIGVTMSENKMNSFKPPAVGVLMSQHFGCGNYDSPELIFLSANFRWCPRPEKELTYAWFEWLCGIHWLIYCLQFWKQKVQFSVCAPWSPFSWDHPSSWSLQSPDGQPTSAKRTQREPRETAPSTRFGWHVCGPGDETWPQTSPITTKTSSPKESVQKKSGSSHAKLPKRCTGGCKYSCQSRRKHGASTWFNSAFQPKRC